VDLFGEHSVQVVAATQALLEAALVLTLAALLVLLSVRVAQQTASAGPLRAIVPSLASHITPPGRDADIPSARGLSTSLPSRAPPPPDPSRVTRVQPPASGQSRAGGVAARAVPPRASA
jgi:hypothetical protein